MIEVEVFVHDKAICESDEVGKGTRVWAFAHILSGAKIGEDCNICDSVFVENDVVIGDRVTVKCGVQLWDGISVGDDVFIGPNATFTNDKTPRSRKYQSQVLRTIVEAGATIGANATILPSLTIGRSAMVAAGAVVTRHVPAHALVAGHPAHIVRFVESNGEPVASRQATTGADLLLAQCRLIALPLHRNASGTLIPVEHGADLPFQPRRTFFLRDIGAGHTRGNHAHKSCAQIVISVAGSLSILIDDGRLREVIVLDDPSVALYLPPMIWCSLFRFSPDCVAMVFASHPYEDVDYIRDYGTFRTMTSN